MTPRARLFAVLCALTLLAFLGTVVDELADLLLAPVSHWVDHHQVLTVALILAALIIALAAWTVAPALRREAVNHRPHPARGRRSRLSSGGRRTRTVSGTRARPPAL